MQLVDIVQIATITGVIFAVFTFIKGIIEYTKQGSQKRAEHFYIMRKKLKENDVFKNMCALLEKDNEELLDVKFADKRDFLGFFEEIALMMNSKIIRKEVAHYMFGYYAIRCWKYGDDFWKSNECDNEFKKRDPYWILFREFAQEMERVEDDMDKKNLKDRMKKYVFK